MTSSGICSLKTYILYSKISQLVTQNFASDSIYIIGISHIQRLHLSQTQHHFLNKVHAVALGLTRGVCPKIPPIPKLVQRYPNHNVSILYSCDDVFMMICGAIFTPDVVLHLLFKCFNLCFIVLQIPVSLYSFPNFRSAAIILVERSDFVLCS